jgi:hypothetical protein
LSARTRVIGGVSRFCESLRWRIGLSSWWIERHVARMRRPGREAFIRVPVSLCLLSGIAWRFQVISSFSYIKRRSFLVRSSSRNGAGVESQIACWGRTCFSLTKSLSLRYIEHRSVVWDPTRLTASGEDGVDLIAVFGDPLRCVWQIGITRNQGQVARRRSSRQKYGNVAM